ncbi:MAG: VTC domain-containing protein [Polyangiaceae bacterium]|nr:VTC domain-containing protein [Polyangiaceae bacterium]
MTAPVPLGSGDRFAADRAITADRDELKYVAPRERVRHLADAVEAALASHRHVGEGANTLPDPHHFVTTIYFDTPSHRHFRAAVQHLENDVKLRAKAYYDLHPCIAELATDPEEVFRYQPFVYLELKQRSGRRTSKHRSRLRPQDIPSFLARAGREAALPEVGGPELARIHEYCHSLGEPLGPACLVNYRRLSWQDPHGTLRITMDLDLAYFAPPADLFARSAPLVRGSLGLPSEIEKMAIIEVKCRTAPPAWLATALEHAEARSALFSKFVRSHCSVHGND